MGGHGALHIFLMLLSGLFNLGNAYQKIQATSFSIQPLIICLFVNWLQYEFPARGDMAGGES